MSVESVSQMWSRDSAKESISDDRRTVSVAFENAYQVLHSADTSKSEILASPLLPSRGQPLETGSSIFVRDVALQPVSPILTIAIASLSGQRGLNGQHPADIPDPEIEWTDAEKDEGIDTDADGNPIVTVNGEPIYGVTEAFADPVLNITRAFRFIDLYSIRAYRRSVNSDTFYGWPPGTARLRKYSAKRVLDDATGGYWMVSASFQFRAPVHTTAAQVWYKRVRHEGLYENVGGEIIRAVDRGGQPVTKPVLLKSDGTREFDINSAHWLTFRTLDPLPYSILGMGI